MPRTMGHRNMSKDEIQQYIKNENKLNFEQCDLAGRLSIPPPLPNKMHIVSPLKKEIQQIWGIIGAQALLARIRPALQAVYIQDGAH